jgi:hypothetical protein
VEVVYVPAMSVVRGYGGECVLSDGRFAILGGWNQHCQRTASCEVLNLTMKRTGKMFLNLEERISSRVCATMIPPRSVV